LVSAFGGSPPPGHDVHDVEVDALMQIIARRNDDRCSPEEIRNLDADTDEAISALLRLEVTYRPDLVFAAELVKTLAKHYAIVAPLPVPANGRTILSYQRMVIPAYSAQPRGRFQELRRKARHMVRNLLGSRPTDVKLALENAGTTNSFHVSVRAPEGLYLSSQQLEMKPVARDRPAKPSANAPYHFEPHFRFRSRLGQSYAHFYGRHFPRPKNPDEIPKLVFRFHEVPPGSDFQAAAAALSAAFLIGLVGFALSHVKPDHDGHLSLGSDAPVLLPAFPGVVASWLGLDETATPLFNGSLSARFSLLCTVTFSALASALYIINNSAVETDVFGDPLPGSFSLLGITKEWWVGLAAFAVLNAMFITYRCVMRASRYVHLSQRSSPE
jgi:hypothetical protein